MQTPYLPKKIFGDDFNKVYEPAEDSFLLLDALEQELELIKRNVNICLECGSGSGVIITALAQAFSSKNVPSDHSLTHINRLLLATDLNWDACTTTKKCAKYHMLDSNVQVVRTDLAEALVDRLENSVDLLVFNPPYVPTDENESNAFSSHTTTSECSEAQTGQLHLSWAGGSQGRKLIDIFLRSYVPRLLSKPDGVAFMIALDQNNPKELVNFLVDEHKIQGKIVLERQAGIERLHVVKYGWLK